jgi:hypothetical protein
MKSLYWNIRGLAKSPSILALKRLVTNNRPDFIFIAGPWIPLQKFSSRWLHRLGYKFFPTTNRGNLLPNLWCFCTNNLNPFLITEHDQHISFNISHNNITFGFSVIYASTCYINRRQLWNSLTTILNSQTIPWAFIGDFNTVLGSHEYRGSHSPARIPINDFSQWTNTNDLIHLPTRGAFYTWANGRGGTAFIEKKT